MKWKTLAGMHRLFTLWRVRNKINLVAARKPPKENLMNKKVMEKIVSITLSIVCLILVVLLLITAFGHIKNSDLDNKIVKGLLVTLMLVFIALSGINIALSFKDEEKLNTVLLFKTKSSAAQATIPVMKKTAKRVCKTIEEGKIKRVNVYADDIGNVRMKIDVKIYSDDTIDVINLMRATIEKTFEEVFGVEFASIDFKITNSKNTYEPTKADVDNRVKELAETMVMNKPLEDEAPKAAAEEVQDEAEETQEQVVEASPAEMDEPEAEASEEVAEEAEIVEDEAEEAEDEVAEEPEALEDEEAEEDEDK